MKAKTEIGNEKPAHREIPRLGREKHRGPYHLCRKENTEASYIPNTQMTAELLRQDVAGNRTGRQQANSID